MGKRNVVVVLSSSSSSSENDNVDDFSNNRKKKPKTKNHSPTAKSRSKSSSRRSLPPLLTTTTTTTTNHNSKKKKAFSSAGGGGDSKRARRGLLPDSSSRSLFSNNNNNNNNSLITKKEEEDVDFDSFCDGFYDGFQVGFRRQLHPAGSLRSDQRELWVDKYKPRSLAELAVHKKKVEEVKLWLEERLRTSKDEFQNQALVITGQAGVGKSATIRAVASHLGVNLCEWKTPTPTLWQEHIHNSNSGTSYMSKLDEFETFVERIRKYSLLALSTNEESKEQYILLIDDLPLANGKAAHGRLCKCLHFLARSTQIPTVILITEYNKVESADNTTRYWEDLQSCLESAGASKIAFNPVTTNSIKKILARICKEEHCNVTAEQIDLIAKASCGDVRHAIASIQYYSLRPGQIRSLSLASYTDNHLKEKLEESELSDGVFSLPFGRDETLSLFHALGKFLHNKRETSHTSSLGKDDFLLRERFVRFPLKLGDPEKVLSQGHCQARPIADFLHENVLDFISDEAIDDAWAVTSYLSDADCLLATFHGSTWPRTITGYHEPEKIVQLAAASVSVRGVLFGNSHPSPSRWHSIRSPKIWQVEQSSRRNKNEMLRQRIEAYDNSSASDISVMATEYRPVLKWLGYRSSEAQRVEEKQWSNMIEEDNSEGTCMIDLESDNEIDEIEDW